MILSNLEDIISILRSKLPDYLMMKGIIEGDPKKKFRCFNHEERTPSMCLNPKANYEVGFCFGCSFVVDIFTACSRLEGLPSSGPEWVKETIPHLAAMFDIPIALGELSEQDRLRGKFYALARDIADLIQHPKHTATSYMQERKWENQYEDCYTIDFNWLMSALLEKGWERDTIHSTKLITVGPTNLPIIGSDKITWVIRDYRKRPIAFISRNLKSEPKYIHSGESPIFLKRETLTGLDLARQHTTHDPLWIVEGQSDRFALLAANYPSVAALCGTALTEFHLNHLKSLGIQDIVLCLDWDKAGQEATEKVSELLHIKKISGLNIKVAIPPIQSDHKDIAELLTESSTQLDDLTCVDLFDWLLSRIQLDSSDDLTRKIIPAIAANPTAIKRDMMARKLADITGISQAAILHDVDKIRNHTYEQKKERIVASTDKYRAAVEQDPNSILTAMSIHEQEITSIENDYDKQSFGASYQLERFMALEQLKFDTTVDRSEFKLNNYKLFGQALSDGLPWTSGTLIYWGGRANAAKTACTVALALDVLISDQDTIVITHLTDDSLGVVGPRLITNTAYLLTGKQVLTIGEAGNPLKGFKSGESSALYSQSVAFLKQAISEERLILLDSEDGDSLSVLERAIKYIRRKYPNKKLLVVQDNTHNVSDFAGMDQNSRISQISTAQKRLAIKYQCCIFATAEYRKNMPVDTTKIKLPTNDDLGDSRAMMFRSSGIVHVYNDLNDRGEDHAETFWVEAFKPEDKLPRLLLIFGKNKITGFKGKLVLDLNPKTVCLTEIPFQQAKAEGLQFLNDKMRIENGELVIETDYED